MTCARTRRVFGAEAEYVGLNGDVDVSGPDRYPVEPGIRAETKDENFFLCRQLSERIE